MWFPADLFEFSASFVGFHWFSLLGFLLVKFGLLPVPACLRVSVYMFPAGFASFHAQQGVPGCRGAIT